MIIDNEIIVDLIKSNNGLIYSIINKYISKNRYIRYYDVDDLYQVATIGIIKAYKNYRKDSDAKFTTYAYKYILSEVVNFVKNSKPIKTTREYHKLYKKILEAKNILTQRLYKEPSNYELSLFLEVDETLIKEVLMYQEEVQSLDASIADDGKKLSILDSITSETSNINIDDIYLKEEINKLSLVEEKIINMRYFQGKTQAEIADELGTNQVQVSRYEKKVLKKLKNNLCKDK